MRISDWSSDVCSSDLAHTLGIDDLRADITATAWEEIVDRSGLAKTAIESMAQTYWQAERVILCYGIGITQHANGTANVQQLANLLLLRGNMGKPDRKSTRLNSSH